VKKLKVGVVSHKIVKYMPVLFENLMEIAQDVYRLKKNDLTQNMQIKLLSEQVRLFILILKNNEEFKKSKENEYDNFITELIEYLKKIKSLIKQYIKKPLLKKSAWENQFEKIHENILICILKFAKYLPRENRNGLLTNKAAIKIAKRSDKLNVKRETLEEEKTTDQNKIAILELEKKLEILSKKIDAIPSQSTVIQVNAKRARKVTVAGRSTNGPKVRIDGSKSLNSKLINQISKIHTQHDDSLESTEIKVDAEFSKDISNFDEILGGLDLTIASKEPQTSEESDSEDKVSPEGTIEHAPFCLNFIQIIKEDKYYIDKTLLIKHVIDDPHRVFIFSRPAMFGKKVQLAMLASFFHYQPKVENIFEIKDQNIWHDDKRSQYQKYYVLYLDFGEHRINTIDSFETARNFLKNVLNEACDIFFSAQEKKENLSINDYIEENNKVFSEKSLYKLINLYYLVKNKRNRVAKQIFLLIQSYDEVLKRGILYSFWERILEFMIDFIHTAVAEPGSTDVINKNIDKVVLTGTLIDCKYNTKSFSSKKYIIHSTIFHHKPSDVFFEDFGFTTKETKELIEKNFPFRVAPLMQEINKYCGGYKIDNHPCHFFSPKILKEFIDFYIINMTEEKHIFVNYLGSRLSSPFLKLLSEKVCFKKLTRFHTLFSSNSIPSETITKKINKEGIYNLEDEMTFLKIALMEGLFTAENNTIGNENGEIWNCSIKITNYGVIAAGSPWPINPRLTKNKILLLILSMTVPTACIAPFLYTISEKFLPKTDSPFMISSLLSWWSKDIINDQPMNQQILSVHA
jgi:Predicted AAA-ATPase